MTPSLQNPFILFVSPESIGSELLLLDALRSIFECEVTECNEDDLSAIRDSDPTLIFTIVDEDPQEACPRLYDVIRASFPSTPILWVLYGDEEDIPLDNRWENIHFMNLNLGNRNGSFARLLVLLQKISHGHGPTH